MKRKPTTGPAEINVQIRPSFSFVCVLLFAAFVSAQDSEFPQFTVHGVLDARVIRTDTTESWLEGGLGKARYGSENGERETLWRLSQASVVFTGALSDVFSARLHVNVDAEPEQEVDRNRLDIVEAFVSYRPVLSPYLRLKIRGGLLFPPVSLENTDVAWTSPYTITASVANSWIGEEIRTTAAESTLVFSRGFNEFAFTGAAFGFNDPAGSLLAWRGWAMHDRQTALSDRLPLAPIPAIGPDGLFIHQPPFVETVREVDDKIGYYLKAGWKHPKMELEGFYYNNRGTPTEFDGTQYAWKTDWANGSLHLFLPANVEILSQYMRGHSKMGPGNAVHIMFYTYFALVSASFGPNRISARYDDFGVDDLDRFHDLDNNEEDGRAWTFAYILRTGEHHRLAFELLRIESERPVRADLGLPVRAEETQLQASIRLNW